MLRTLGLILIIAFQPLFSIWAGPSNCACCTSPDTALVADSCCSAAPADTEKATPQHGPCPTDPFCAICNSLCRTLCNTPPVSLITPGARAAAPKSSTLPAPAPWATPSPTLRPANDHPPTPTTQARILAPPDRLSLLCIWLN